MRNHKYLIILSFFFCALKSIAQGDLKSDSYIFTEEKWDSTFAKKNSDSMQISVLPILSKIQWIQDHPYNWNDGSMVQAKGWQQMIRGGIHMQFKCAEFQFAPEIVLAQNLDINNHPADSYDVLWRDYYRYYNFIELPDQMGTGLYKKFRPGQSFLKFHYKKWSFALSTQNKWWGPTQRNALLLSNSAAGFPHISISNQTPLHTKIGSFHVELIAGKVTNGGWRPPNSHLSFRGNPLYLYKIPYDRTLNGFHLNYSPKWFTNLTIGIEQMFMQNTKDMRWHDYIPVKSIISRFPDEKITQPIVMTATYFNYEMPKSGVTMYGEFGWNLYKTTLRNWLLQPDKGYASVLGIKKIFKTAKAYTFDLLAEIAQLQLLTRAEQLSNGIPTSWYLGSNVRQGYTHDGQLLGAGVGPGGSSQTLEFNWRKNKHRVGIMAERRVHNNDYYVYAFSNSLDFRRFYIDVATTLKADIQYKNWTIAPRISYIYTNNYQWYLFQAVDQYFIPGRDVQQWAGQLNLIYTL